MRKLILLLAILLSVSLLKREFLEAAPQSLSSAVSRSAGQETAKTPPVEETALVLNEVDYDQPSADGSEFIEIKNISGDTVGLDGYSVGLVNGAAGGAVIYKTVNLPAVSLAPGDYYVICGDAANVDNCDLDVSPNTNLIQNGAPDAVVLLFGEIPVDAVSYEGNTADPYTEGSAVNVKDDGANDGESISRFPDGSDSDDNDSDFVLMTNSPGEPNGGIIPMKLNVPDGGESWGAGTNRQITWTSNGVSGNVRLEYSAGAPAEGEPWILIDASTPNDGSYLWSVPNNPTSAALVRVSSVSDPGIQDVSDGAFTITGSALAVTRPNGAESFSIGAKENVNWNPGGLSGTVRLEYSTDNGANWSVIQASVANDGKFKWTVPATASAQSLVRVTSNLVPSITDVSDAVFTIGASAFALTNPTGGENWTVGSAQYIQWNPDGLGGTVALWYSTDGGAGWTSIDAATLNDGSFKWFIPNQVTAQAQVRIETNLTPSNADTSGDFTISAPGLLLIRPNGGESFVVGTKESIFWNTGGLSGTVRLEYSTDGGGSFSIIKASVANDGNFRWLVPNDVTAQARVRVRSNSAPSIADTSDNDFAISLTLPKGGQIGELIPEAFGIYQNFPNPFNPSTQIRYDLPEASEVTLKVYNMLGKEVSTLAQGMKPAGIHFSTFDATGLSSGMYIYRIQSKGLSQKIHTQILKMVYVK